MWATPLPAAADLPERCSRSSIVTPLGPLVYRLAYERTRRRERLLVLLIVSIGVHFALTGLGLVFFGAEGFRKSEFLGRAVSAFGDASCLSGQTIIIFARLDRADRGAVPVLRTHAARQGACVRPAVNRLGARPDGHLDHRAPASLSFGLAAFMGALSGLLDRADDDALLRLRFPDRPQGLRRGDLRRPGELPGGCGGRDLAGRPARELRIVLRECIQGK